MNVAIFDTNTKRIHPKKFALWVGLVGMVMLFAALTSAYIVKRAGKGWEDIPLPDMFYYSTAVMVVSSITLHVAYISFKRANAQLYKTLLIVSFILGVLFVLLQYLGWEQLRATKIYVETNPSSSFLYLLTGLHAAHVLAGIAAIAVSLTTALIQKFNVHPKRILRLELVVTFWHFLDVLWIYLLIFLLVQQ